MIKDILIESNEATVVIEGARTGLINNLKVDTSFWEYLISKNMLDIHVACDRKGSKGYFKFAKNGDRTPIHKLVMEYYGIKPPKETEYVIDHINGNTHDNRLVNLRWITESQNRQSLFRSPESEFPRNIYKTKSKKWAKTPYYFRLSVGELGEISSYNLRGWGYYKTEKEAVTALKIYFKKTIGIEYRGDQYV